MLRQAYTDHDNYAPLDIKVGVRLDIARVDSFAKGIARARVPGHARLHVQDLITAYLLVCQVSMCIRILPSRSRPPRMLLVGQVLLSVGGCRSQAVLS